MTFSITDWQGNNPVEGDSIVAGDKAYRGAGLGVHVLYPNPLNADRAVVVFGAVDWRGM